MPGRRRLAGPVATPRRLAALAAAAVLATGAVAGCGDEERGDVTVEQGGTGTTGTGTAGTGTATAPRTDTGPQATVTTPDSSQPPPSGGGSGGGSRGGAGSGSPESQQGGAGDEVPASSQALLTGRGGRITPRLVRVPPYIAIRVELRSADGERYRLTANGRSVEAGGQIASSSATFDGLRPGDRLVLTGPSGRVAVEASAEPGP